MSRKNQQAKGLLALVGLGIGVWLLNKEAWKRAPKEWKMGPIKILNKDSQS